MTEEHRRAGANGASNRLPVSRVPRAWPRIRAADPAVSRTVAETGDKDGTALKSKPTSTGTLLDWLAVILPPTTVLTALAFWLGYTLTAALTNYLGIDVSTLEFTTTNYLLRSTDAVIVPATLALTLILAGLGTHAVVLALQRTGRWIIWIRAGSAALVVLVMALVSCA